MNEIKIVTNFGTIRIIPTHSAGVEMLSDIDRDDSDWIDAVESVILGHYSAGIDVTDPKYIEGINTALEAMDNNS
jgi:hypothetical protein